jgi:uncharacterized protein
LIAPQRLREPLPDALRALALAGVLIVNGLGYRDVPEGRLLGAVLPADSLWAQGATALVAAFVQGKAYPMLSLLFGMGIAYAMRGRPLEAARQGAHRRGRRLLLLGLLHGLFIYFGDILTLYALCTLLVARHAREPWQRFGRRLRRAVVWALLAVAAAGALAVWMPPDSAMRGPTIGSVGGYVEFLGLNAPTFVVAQTIGLLFAFPLVRLGMLAGIAATRLRLLTHPRWRSRIAAALRRWLVPLLVANLAYGVSYAALPDRGRAGTWVWVLEVVGPLWSVPLALCYAALAALVWHSGRRAWALWLAPLGQHTLSVYVGASLLMLCLFSGAGLGWQPTTAGWVFGASALWLLAATASRRWRGRWPLESWMARR